MLYNEPRPPIGWQFSKPDMLQSVKTTNVWLPLQIELHFRPLQTWSINWRGKPIHSSINFSKPSREGIDVEQKG